MQYILKPVIFFWTYLAPITFTTWSDNEESRTLGYNVV